MSRVSELETELRNYHDVGRRLVADTQHSRDEVARVQASLMLLLL